jgi:hypothetical protein
MQQTKKLEHLGRILNFVEFSIWRGSLYPNFNYVERAVFGGKCGVNVGRIAIRI